MIRRELIFDRAVLNQFGIPDNIGEHDGDQLSGMRHYLRRLRYFKLEDLSEVNQFLFYFSRAA